MARLSGTVVAPELSPHRLTVEHGTFRLLVPDPTHVETWHMFYEMTLRTEDDTRYRFFGFKLLRERSGLYAWHDTSTLFVTIVRGSVAAAAKTSTSEEPASPSISPTDITSCPFCRS